MSTHHGRRTSLVRAKTSIGLKTSHQECMESVSELLVALEKERQMEQVMMKSVEQWTEIVDEITTSMDSATPSETEWKNRFHYQRLFNEMLTQEIGHIKTELYMLGQGRTGMTLPVTEHAQSKSPRSNHHRESQTYIKCLQEKLKSLESLYNMYEHQRDDASRDYHRLKEEINKIVKDVAFKQRTRITSQEEWDKKEIARPKNAGKTLPPLKGTLRNKTSYLKLHEVKSGTSKIADKGKSSHMWKGAGKLPPVNNTRRNKKDKNISSDKSKRPQGVQEKWTNVSKADVLPPIDKANCNREVNKSKLKGHGQRDKSLLTDPKLPSMRMKRIASLKTDSDGVTSAAIRKERVRGGVRETDTGTHEGYVCHVDDQRAGSSCNEDITQAGIMTGYNTKKSIGERSERNREGCVENKCGTSIVNNDDNMCSLGRKSPTSTTVKSPFRKSEIEVLNGENMLVSNQSLHQKETRSLSKEHNNIPTR
ncbi:uncharacterized protein LOC117324792 [Pecten maximus]|uniref:uncharacterized protein LOC117324792 n=1 Tax=Pecten maximus TaxID=6579 RepID=UPI001458423C|nr:uncharacterized protein LOC117324792 [Pecten maximus]